MPKIIENIREKLLEEAKRQVMEKGYATMTIRSVASACGVGLGTVYNYFDSKDMLVASFMLEDWIICKQTIDAGCKEKHTIELALRYIYDGLNSFIEKYESVFKDESAGVAFASSSKQHHKVLCKQIAEPLLPFCQEQKRVKAEFLAEFVAESMLTWVCAECAYEDISSVLLQLF